MSSDWQSDPELTESEEYDGTPTTSLLGDLRRDDSVIVTFHDDGETVERDHGRGVRFSVTIEEVNGKAFTWDDEVVEDGEEYNFETTSKPLLGLLAQVDLEGNTFEIIRNKMGPADPEEYYSIVEQ